jgi:hypothetical protein
LAEKFRRPQLIDGSGWRTGVEIHLWYADQLVETPNDFRVTSAAPELGKGEEQAEADEERQERDRTDDDPFERSEHTGQHGDDTRY